MFEFTLTATNRDQLYQKLLRLEPTTLWQVSVKERKSKRSTEQNSRLWRIYKIIGDTIGLDADEVHQLMGYKFLRYQKEVNGKTEEFIKSTTKLNTAEMAEYQDGISRWASQIGVWIE